MKSSKKQECPCKEMNKAGFTVICPVCQPPRCDPDTCLCMPPCISIKNTNEKNK